ncbi:DUF4174 domain-containing protein [Rhodobacteraceae bacterium HSP-20]|uniref:DUF4174 domain-containing protein n=1 Tax=Paragemmobacter amnigenus TaxID=2852097 RepID=A0ABS6IZE0_9RHOB|nr:DUF4174 domain-containing protein [Rhodobacter amnigenus]MBU9696896.1 DUF4174 domain-containing protein [Rhodobacter amnigenus]MBV4388123.1 DUF4174 domain-containing protein [Rhodobacter amnigenus]
MKLLRILLVAALLPLAATAQEAAEETGFAPVPADAIVWEELLYVKRPVVVFADSPNDPNFIRQMELIARDAAELAERDVILITDTDPAARTEVRQKLRPRGFSLVLLDKDLKPVIRKPLPWEVREITHAIDKFPLRRQEIQQGAGRGAGG